MTAELRDLVFGETGPVPTRGRVVRWNLPPPLFYYISHARALDWSVPRPPFHRGATAAGSSMPKLGAMPTGSQNRGVTAPQLCPTNKSTYQGPDSCLLMSLMYLSPSGNSDRRRAIGTQLFLPLVF